MKKGQNKNKVETKALKDEDGCLGNGLLLSGRMHNEERRTTERAKGRCFSESKKTKTKQNKTKQMLFRSPEAQGFMRDGLDGAGDLSLLI